MKMHVVFIQGAGEGAYEEDEKLVTDLRNRLTPDYEIHYPRMTDEDQPDYKSWKHQIEKELGTLEGTLILIGHSVGASILIKSVTETKIKNPVAGIFLIASPYWGSKGWTYEGYEVFVLPNDLPTKLPRHAQIFLYHSSDDETVPFAHLALYSQQLPQATVRELDGRGHQLENNLSEVAGDIKKLHR